MLFMRKWKRWVRWTTALLLVFLTWVTVRVFLLEALKNQSNDRSHFEIPHSLWSSNPADEMWLPHVKAHRSDETPLVVVEEHHEVLKYWFQAAEQDFVPKSRNTLIHIDGHIDGAIPFEMDDIPWFRFPRSQEEVHNMMQRNDMFIAAAVLSGFIDHVIWVWPDWDGQSHDEVETDHMIFDFQIGFTKLRSLCACWKLRNVDQTGEQQDASSSAWDCRRHNSSEVDIGKEPVIKPSDCDVQEEGVLELLRETSAEAVLKTMNKENRIGGLILDIDEDYFGCWSDVITFKDINIYPDKIDLISDLVSDFLCASSAREELEADHFYVALIHLVINLKQKSCSAHMQQSCLSVVEISNYLIENVPNILEFLAHQKKEHILCGHIEKINGLLLQSLLKVLDEFNIDQLTTLSQIGICLDTSPSSIYFPISGDLHVCHGDNTPEKTEVTFSLPENKDIIVQTKTLKSILSSILPKPDLITVCRSIRDGYTPKEYFRMIESAVLTSTSSVYRSVSLKSVHFDGNLLGGALGWPERVHTWNTTLLNYLKLS